MKINTIKICRVEVHPHHLDLQYSADDFNFNTKLFYHDVSFPRLIQQYSQSQVDQVIAHIALFEGMKFCSLFPELYDISLISQDLSTSSVDLFFGIYQGVFGQHWYENNVTDYAGPKILGELGQVIPFELSPITPTVLIPCGGGKDSALALKMMEEADIAFSSMQYSHSVYGKSDYQHQLINQVTQHSQARKQHQISIIDDFLDYPFFDLYFPDNSGLIAPETPVSIFESLPLMMQEGYQSLCLAHEKSANRGNLFWDAIDQEVNHQWGKGYEAERSLNEFIQNNLVSNFSYFSILQPIYDVRIFDNFSRYPELFDRVHSCNVQKPWCKKCPKCAYVWLGFMATCDPAQVNEVFGINLFDDDDLLPTFREMIGLEDHTPFECIGEIEESRLLMKRCLDKGLSGKALDVFQENVLSDRTIDWQQLEQKYVQVYREDHSIPDWIFEKIEPFL